MSATSPTRDDYWRIDGIPDQIDGLPIDGHPGAEATQSYGQGYSLGVRLSERSDPELAPWDDYVARYQTLLNTYAPHAGQFELQRHISGHVSYVSSHTGASLLIAVRPPEGTMTGRGGYYLVSSVTDQTTLPERLCRLEIDVTYLAALDEYDSLADAQSLLEAPGI